MNPDNFEKRLQRQPLRQPPAEWKNEILATAKTYVRPVAASGEPDLLTGWRILLARISPAWVALVALWLVIIGVNSFLSGSSVRSIASASRGTPTELMTVRNLHRFQASLLADQWEEASALVPTPRRIQTPPPRSEIRREEQYGEFAPGLPFTSIA